MTVLLILNILAYIFLGVVFWGLIWRGLVWLPRKLKILPGARILLSFLVLGILMGLFSVWVWPGDFVTLLNVIGVLLGDLIYSTSIRLFGDPYSSQAHFTIPWLLRTPQVYALVSFLLCGIIGVTAQIIFNSRTESRPDKLR